MTPETTRATTRPDHSGDDPEILRALLSAMTEEQTYWKPAPDRWSVAEILEHLCILKVTASVCAWSDGKGGNAFLEAYDQEALAAAGQYYGRSG